jgi:hypothetical protein
MNLVHVAVVRNIRSVVENKFKQSNIVNCITYNLQCCFSFFIHYHSKVHLFNTLVVTIFS